MAESGYSFYPNLEQQYVDQLVKQALSYGDGNLQEAYKQPFWRESKFKEQAFQQLQKIFSSPQTLAKYVADNKVQNLQEKRWWSDNPMKMDAWKIIDPSYGLQTSQTDSSSPSTVQRKKKERIAYQPKSTSTQTTQNTNIENMTTLEQAYALADESGLPPDLIKIFKDVTRSWDLSKPINFENIISEFKKIQQDTIDPNYYELANVAIDEINRARDYQVAANERENEAMRAKAHENIKGTVNDLEARGMTFSGEAANKLGAGSAFTPNAGEVPGVPFGGALPEGTVNRDNRLMATSLAARQANDLQELQRSAEKYFGSNSSYSRINPLTGQYETLDPMSSTVVPGASALGGITGTLQKNRVKDYANTLNLLGGQSGQNTQAQDYLKFNFNQ